MFFGSILDFVFPNYCIGCHKRINYDSFTCEKCANILQYSKVKILQNHLACDYVFAAFPYQGIIKKEIIAFKFHQKRYLKKAFARELIQVVETYQIQFDHVIPVPISRIRYRERGYNQSEEIASILAKRFHKKMHSHLLQKIKDNPRQSTLSKNERQDNVKGVYQVKESNQLKAKTVLLVDDIFTTGATVSECARVLKQSGVQKVIVLTIAYAR